MSSKPSTSASTTIDHLCQHISPKGNRCHMLIDENHRSVQGTGRPTLCAYHADRLRANVPAVDPEALASDLLGEVNNFSTARSVNFFLGNLAKQLARKRIARRDAIALAYISQLLLNSLPALERQLEAEREAEKEAQIARINARIRQQNRELAARRNQQATNSAQAAPPDAGKAADPVVAGL